MRASAGESVMSKGRRVSRFETNRGVVLSADRMAFSMRNFDVDANCDFLTRNWFFFSTLAKR